MSTSQAPRGPQPATVCARSPTLSVSSSAPLVPPVELSVVYCPRGLEHVDQLYEGQAQGYIYAREAHPNADQLASKLAELEGAESAVVCSSGMAAISAVLLTLADAGDHLIIADELYGKTSVLVERELARLGMVHDRFNAARPAGLGQLIRPTTRAILVETLSNPLLRVADLGVIAATARQARVALVVDATFTPLLCRPLALGASVVVHSATKMIGGHSDLTLGVVAGSQAEVARVRQVAAAFGFTGNPFESWLALRGLATLALRVERASATAEFLAHAFEDERSVGRVWYPRLASHPDSHLANQLLVSGGSMLAIDLGNKARADAFIKALEGKIPFAPSLGDVQTTLSHPWTTSHRGQDPARLERLGITPGVVRISVGLEDPRDLWGEFARALAAARA